MQEGMATHTSHAVAAFSLAGVLAGCAAVQGSEERHAASTGQRAGLRLQLASAYYEQGQFEVALQEANQAIALAPALPEAHGMRALVYAGLRKPLLAEQDFLYALRLAPHNPELSNNYGQFLCQAGRAAQAMAYFDAALHDGGYASPEKAMLNAGLCSLSLNDSRRAGAYFTRALAHAPGQAVALAGLARVHYEQHDYRQAALYLERLAAAGNMESQPADVLWLGIKVQHKLGNTDAEAGLAALLRRHHFASAEYAAYQSGAFDE